MFYTVETCFQDILNVIGWTSLCLNLLKQTCIWDENLKFDQTFASVADIIYVNGSFAL